ncbi:hypothetical protein TYRP_000532 [Tyrophagus putrescentiae]|nr:hypothetical protein TYRP_000532 [Tyrophagus putrescentiae]
MSFAVNLMCTVIEANNKLRLACSPVFSRQDSGWLNCYVIWIPNWVRASGRVAALPYSSLIFL